MFWSKLLKKKKNVRKSTEILFKKNEQKIKKIYLNKWSGVSFPLSDQKNKRLMLDSETSHWLVVRNTGLAERLVLKTKGIHIATVFNSVLALECWETLNCVASSNNVGLIWVPGHGVRKKHPKITPIFFYTPFCDVVSYYFMSY